MAYKQNQAAALPNILAIHQQNIINSANKVLMNTVGTSNVMR